MRSTPVISVLSRTPLLFGGEVKFVAGNLAVGFVGQFMLEIVGWFVVTLVIHLLLVQMAKRDPKTRQIYLTYQHQADRYEPWTDGTTLESDRPVAFTNREHL
jgi:type IV secretory pathway TrbD component